MKKGGENGTWNLSLRSKSVHTHQLYNFRGGGVSNFGHLLFKNAKFAFSGGSKGC